MLTFQPCPLKKQPLITSYPHSPKFSGILIQPSGPLPGDIRVSITTKRDPLWTLGMKALGVKVLDGFLQPYDCWGMPEETGENEVRIEHLPLEQVQRTLGRHILIKTPADWKTLRQQQPEKNTVYVVISQGNLMSKEVVKAA